VGALRNLVESTVPQAGGAADEPTVALWQTALLAKAMVERVVPHLPHGAEPGLALAALAHNIGEHIPSRKSQATSEEQIDLSWLLLVSWNVPPPLLNLLRQRHLRSTPGGRLLACAADWAGGRVSHDRARCDQALGALAAEGVPDEVLRQLEHLPVPSSS